ncbi:MAG: acyclic terpene utilization AtuA family protein [Gemmatimonadaceae bacterium]|nr:acyclic terpene utilization AtuA family protein [Gemmatimonadaceae bacterium]
MTIGTVRVASGQGFWGDSLDAPRQQVEGGPIDYLMLDYLAEVTMSILQKQKERDPAMGYARDFIGAIESVLPAIVERGVKVIANAGGVNPVACAQALVAAIAKAGHGGKVKVGIVTGDDLLPRLDELLGAGHELQAHGHRRALSTVPQPRPVRKCVHRVHSDRAGAAAGGADRRHRALHRHGAHDGAVAP